MGEKSLEGVSGEEWEHWTRIPCYEGQEAFGAETEMGCHGYPVRCWMNWRKPVLQVRRKACLCLNHFPGMVMS